MSTCVCKQPDIFCGGTDIDTDEPDYCKACDELDREEHCLRCPFECCAESTLACPRCKKPLVDATGDWQCHECQMLWPASFFEGTS